MTKQKIVPIFSGGGTRFSAHVGILQALEELDIEFDTLVGISGGAIVASLYANGMSIKEMLKLAQETQFRDFKDFSIWRLLYTGGLSSGNKFENWMETHLQGKTFADLDYNFHVVATDLNGGGPVVFSKASTPEVKVSYAVRCSMSIPLIFNSKTFKHYLLVDGAILSEDALFNDWRGDGTPNICFRLRSNFTPDNERQKKRFVLPQQVYMLIRTFMNALSREYVNANFWHQTIVIDSGNTSAIDFDTSVEDKMMLYQVGLETVKQFLPVKLNSYRQQNES
jgi:NTE family protein